MNVDPLFLLGILMLGMGLGALLMRIRYRGAIKEIVRNELLTTQEQRS